MEKIEWVASGNYYSHKIGDITKHDGQWVEIVNATASYFDDDDEDAYVFGIGPGITMYYSAVPAPPDAVVDHERKQQERNDIIRDILELRDLFNTTGTKPQREIIRGELYLRDATDSQCLSWFDIAEDGIWYCTYNGGDGHYWGESNINSPGMAIGMRLDYSPELADRIKKADQYIKDNDISLHQAIRSERLTQFKTRNKITLAT